MATLIVKTTTDFRNQFLSDISDIVLAGTGVSATFDAAQFNDVNIDTNVAVTAINANQEIRVILASPRSFTAAAWDVSGWRPDARLVFEGSTGTDSITGTAAADIIRGGNGRDALRGGGGNDTFRVDADDLVSGEFIDGGTHSGSVGDILSLEGGGSFNLALASITGVERLQLAGASTVTMSAAQAAAFRSFDNQSGLAQSVTVSGSVVDLSHLSFANWNDSVARITINGASFHENTLKGSFQAETIAVTTGINTITGRGGADTLIGGARRDTFEYLSPSDIRAGESIDGNGDLDTIALITLGLEYDFREVSIREVEILEFRSGISQRVTFADTQIRGGAANEAIHTVIGDAGTNKVVLHGSSTDLSTVSFVNWDEASDGVTIIGTVGNDTLTGSAQDDVIVGVGGVDTLAGGSGDDKFQYFSSGELTNNTINGGTGTDTVTLVSGGTYFFSESQLTSVEALSLSSGAAAHVTSAQVAAGGIGTVIGSAGVNSFSVRASLTSGTTIDLSATAFSSWTAGEDIIVINGTNGADSLTGTNNDDRIVASLGADRMIGLGGNDTFAIGNADIAAGEVIDGGEGIDTLASSNNFLADFTGATLTSIEVVTYDLAFEASLLFRDTQVRAGAIATVTGSNQFNRITVTGPSVDLSGVSFTSWDNATDSITAQGTSGADTVIGSAQNDTLNGGALGDVLNGGGGVNTLSYAGSAAGVVVNLGNGQVSGGDAQGDVISNFANLIGSSAADTLIGDGAANQLQGGGGADFIFGGVNDDLIEGGVGADTLNGEAGVNTLSYAASAAGVTVNLGNGQTSGGDAQGDTISNFQNLTGSAHVDALLGDGTANIIDGGAGADNLFGGLNNDTFVFRRGQANGDIVFDFAGNGAAAGDQLQFIGYGAGATLVQIDATHWRVDNSATPDVITFENGAAIHASDVLFV